MNRDRPPNRQIFCQAQLNNFGTIAQRNFPLRHSNNRYWTIWGNDCYLSRVPRANEGLVLGQAVRRLRTDRGWTQEDLADAAGLTSTYVGQIERGDKIPSLTVVLKLARGLAISPSELLMVFTPSVLRSLKL